MTTTSTPAADLSPAPWTIAIERNDIRQARAEADPPAPLADGEIRLAIDCFALTANNVTYALFGKPAGLFGPDAAGNDQGYWDFFAGRDAPGRLPVWGFATVVESRAHNVAPGDCFYGYYPMASHAVLRPGHAGRSGFADTTPRRSSLPPIYNQYQRLDALADYRPADHDYWPVFRPLFLTGWLIADQCADEGDYGADQILIASASSKTAMGLAHALHEREGPRPRTIGLTSAANVLMVEALGLYDRVIAYDALSSLDAATPSVLIDMAGNGAVTRAVHSHFGATLKASIIVGKSHWDADSGNAALPGPPRTGFFAPARSQKRAADWGPRGLGERIAQAWLSFMAIAPAATRIDTRHGADAALAAYHELLAGESDPGAGIIIRP